MERGIVSMRVGFVLRSTEIKPLFRDLFEHTTIVFMCNTHDFKQLSSIEPLNISPLSVDYYSAIERKEEEVCV